MAKIGFDNEKYLSMQSERIKERIVLAGGMMGEFSPAMARAVAESPAQKVLVPVSRCGVQVAGLEAKPLGGYIADAAELILTQCRSSAL